MVEKIDVELLSWNFYNMRDQLYACGAFPWKFRVVGSLSVLHPLRKGWMLLMIGAINLKCIQVSIMNNPLIRILGNIISSYPDRANCVLEHIFFLKNTL